MKMRILLAALAGVLVIGTGCAGAQTFTSARTLDTGKTEATLVAGATRQDAGTPYGVMPFPALGVQVRHGLSETFEAGGAVGQEGITGLLKVGLLRSSSPSGGLSLSLAPEFALIPFAAHSHGAFGSVAGELPVLLGFHLGGGHEITFAPRVRWANYGQHPFTAGATLGMALRLSDLFMLTPEVGVMLPVASSSSMDPYIPSVGLGLTWGR